MKRPCIETSKLQIINDKIAAILKSHDPRVEFQTFNRNLEHMMSGRHSKKHMCHRGFKDVFLEAA